jgi:hypothetical protein
MILIFLKKKRDKSIATQKYPTIGNLVKNTANNLKISSN